jgi:hypothetical protein
MSVGGLLRFTPTQVAANMYTRTVPGEEHPSEQRKPGRSDRRSEQKSGSNSSSEVPQEFHADAGWSRRFLRAAVKTSASWKKRNLRLSEMDSTAPGNPIVENASLFNPRFDCIPRGSLKLYAVKLNLFQSLAVKVKPLRRLPTSVLRLDDALID